ncbi:MULTISPECIES: tRNA dihydrouridine synthase DusB [Pseudomonadati]|uniref:tRNA-dihydrouridine synthase B n=2 Tax=Shewanella TaxID=22 RepID=A0A9X2WQG1_9GAMM|nr:MULTISPECIES: tRNA dihydrouridine synthase DusB [Shewanella]MCL1116476.1 tRNA dihydrouridine synthase DusB [Shewanella aestuarii]MCT7943465.1 tRNA dihydrouridine synthase DusB [Shewanella holmiensis]MDP5147428.1 tRNA dihydrouridine synthase DusB [Shewanella sp. ULN5]GGN71696.1 tRNA-dihydrouridine synthase B [Shewanella aestuarii]
MRIGPYQLSNQLIVAPMAGVTDQAFRNLCLRYGAALAVSEMLSSNPDVWDSDKSRVRMAHSGEEGIRSVQIAGADPDLMANAAQFNVEQGAHIIDINMGCPAKKVNKKLAGSALMQNPCLVKEILQAVVSAVDVPVSLKIRTGWDPDNRNGIQIAQIAQDCGIASLAVHGRTRQCMYKGFAEYDTIKAIKQNISIPVVANGDIDSPEKAKFVLDYTGADAVMIGRGAQGRPWIFKEIQYYLETGKKLAPIKAEEQRLIMLEHLNKLYELYGEYKGVRFARKHIGWYLNQEEQRQWRADFNRLETAVQQHSFVECYFEELV